MSQIVTLIGGTGLVGSHILQLLLNDDLYSTVRIIGRRSVNINHTKLHEFIIDFGDQKALEQAIAGSETVFVAVGTTQKQVEGDKEAYKKVDYDIPVNVAKAAAKYGVYGFVLVSSVGADPNNNNNFYLKLKGVTEESVAKEMVPQTLIFRPSLLLGERKEKRFGEGIAQFFMPAVNFLLPASKQKYKGIKVEDLAKAIVLAAQKTPKGIHFFEYPKIMELLKPVSNL
jgi:uncharacterized protein YbjT (DUF2867 family)